jgi:hypothetical protein
MKRHPDLSIRKPEKLTTTRARMLNPVVVTNYFNDLDALLDKLDLKEKPDQIWNCDETGKNFQPFFCINHFVPTGAAEVLNPCKDLEVFPLATKRGGMVRPAAFTQAISCCYKLL